MKIRNGFVSNSSSSSFLVAWDKEVTKLSDVTKFVKNRKEAEFLYDYMKDTGGVMICYPPTENCPECPNRFKCYTGRPTDDLLLLIIGGGYREMLTDYSEDEIDEMKTEPFFVDLAAKFARQHKGKVAYCFRIHDGGEGGEPPESNMRSGEWCRNIPHEAWQ
jgi:hypothetical protein